MDAKLWNEPVKFETGMGEVEVITSTVEASRFLSKHWEADTGPKFIEAQRACLDALLGVGQLESARSAFIQACEEAHMQVMH